MESTGLFAEAIGDLMMTSVKPGTGPLTERLSARLASIDCEIDRLSEERSRLLAALPEHHAQAIEDEAGFLAAPDAISAEEAEARGADDQGGDSWVAATIAHLRSVGLIPEGAH